MENFLQQKLLDNTIQSYLVAGGIILLAVLVKGMLSKYIARLLYKLMAKHAKRIAKQSFLDLVMQPLSLFFITLVTVIVIDKLSFPTRWNITLYRLTLHQLADSVAAATIIIIFVWLCLRMIDFVAMIMEEKANLTADQADNQLIIFFKDFFKVLLVLIGVLLLLRFSFNKNIGSLLTGLSIVGAAIALATRESLENLIASVIIFFDRPFVIGDLIKVNNFTGTIERIGLRSTRIRTLDKTYITVPNKQMVDTIVDNITLRTQRKVEIRLEIGLNCKTELIKILIPAIRQLLEKPTIENKMVFFMETGKNAHIISIEYFTSILPSIEDFNQLREDINLELTSLLEALGIEMAAQNREVIIKSASQADGD